MIFNVSIFAQAVADELPILSVRLKTLDHVHKTACTFASRLESLEADVSTLNVRNLNSMIVFFELKLYFWTGGSEVQQRRVVCIEGGHGREHLYHAEEPSTDGFESIRLGKSLIWSLILVLIKKLKGVNFVLLNFKSNF